MPIEIFAQEPEIRHLIEQNRGAVERLGNVETITLRGKLVWPIGRELAAPPASMYI